MSIPQEDGQLEIGKVGLINSVVRHEEKLLSLFPRLAKQHVPIDSVDAEPPNSSSSSFFVMRKPYLQTQIKPSACYQAYYASRSKKQAGILVHAPGRNAPLLDGRQLLASPLGDAWLRRLEMMDKELAVTIGLLSGEYIIAVESHLLSDILDVYYTCPSVYHVWSDNICIDF